MKKLLYTLFLVLLLAACAKPVPTPTATPTATITRTPTASATPVPPTETPTITLTPTPLYPPEGLGPSNFPSGVNPLTGLQVADPALLDRRPLLISVSNLPRDVRPQWGLSLADIIFEYYTQAGTTRFGVLFYGQDAEMTGPIRSGRFFDAHLVRGYKAVFAFAGAGGDEMGRFLSSEFANRLVSLGSPPLFRISPADYNHLMVKTADLSAYATQQGIDNGRQNLDGMFFKLEAPAGGQTGTQAIVRYSGSIYNRWDYDPTTGKYLRFSDTAEDLDGQNPQYQQLTDRLTNQPIVADNMIVLYVTQDVYYANNEGNKIYDILFSGSGNAVAFRDGQMYKVRWQRNSTDVVSLTNLDGTPFPFKPGITWLEVMGESSSMEQTTQGGSFLHIMP